MSARARDWREQLEEGGFVLIEGALDPARSLDPIVAEYDALLAKLADRLCAAGEISDPYAGLPFRERLTEIYRETGQTFAQYFNLSLPMTGVTEETPFWTGPAIFNLIREPALLDLIEAVIGSEIASNPIQHIRIKPPEHILADDMRGSGLVGATPWHQDAAVLPPEAETELVTAWVPISDAPIESGCLQFLKGAHRRGLVRHGFGPVDGLEMPRGAVDIAPVAVPARRGDVILIHRHCPHASLPNLSDRVRFSLDLRYHPAHQRSGREIFPSFIARSRSVPGRELGDAKIWESMWKEARTWLATSAEAPRETYGWLRERA